MNKFARNSEMWMLEMEWGLENDLIYMTPYL